MRVCDICSTPIPFGEDHCPNCGFRYKKERKLSESQRKENKANYMAQFQPHPSPIRNVKRMKTVSDRREDALLVKKVLKWIILVSLFLSIVPISIGVIFTMTNILDFEIVDNDQSEYVYEWFDDYEMLSSSYPEFGKEVKPCIYYLEEIVEKHSVVEMSDYFYQDYNIEEDGLGYVYICRDLYHDEVNFTDVSIYRDSIFNDWYLTLSTYDSFGVMDDIKANEEILTIYAEIMDISKDDLVNVVNDFVRDIDHGDHEETEIGISDVTIYLSYHDDLLEYSLEKQIE